MKNVILDSWALISFFENDKYALLVEHILQKAKNKEIHASMCSVNMGEVYYIVENRRGVDSAEEMLAILEQLPVEIVPADYQVCLDAARIKARYSLPYADSFVTSLARSREGHILTGDPDFKKVEQIVKIDWLK